MTQKKAFIYTALVFSLLTLFSYLANAQPRQLSLQNALSLALANNREIKINTLDVNRAQQQVVVSKSAALPSAGVTAQMAHYFYETPFFGIGSNNSPGEKVPYDRFGGRDQATAIAWITQPLYNAATNRESSMPNCRNVKAVYRY